MGCLIELLSNFLMMQMDARDYLLRCYVVSLQMKYKLRNEVDQVSCPTQGLLDTSVMQLYTLRSIKMDIGRYLMRSYK